MARSSIGLKRQFLERQLMLPIYSLVSFKKRRGRPKGSFKEKSGNDLVWTDEIIVNIADYLIQDALKSLNDKETNPERRMELLEWVSVPIRDIPKPYSFQSYAMLAGLDAEELRDQLMLIIQNDPLNAITQQENVIDLSFTKDDIIEAILFGIDVESRERKSASKNSAAFYAA
jgi:hypothetical protein